MLKLVGCTGMKNTGWDYALTMKILKWPNLNHYFVLPFDFCIGCCIWIDGKGPRSDWKYTKGSFVSNCRTRRCKFVFRCSKQIIRTDGILEKRSCFVKHYERKRQRLARLQHGKYWLQTRFYFKLNFKASEIQLEFIDCRHNF